MTDKNHFRTSLPFTSCFRSVGDSLLMDPIIDLIVDLRDFQVSLAVLFDETHRSNNILYMLS